VSSAHKDTLSEVLLAKIAKSATVRGYSRNAIIVTEGDDTDSMYVLVSGRVRVFVSGEDGREFEINRIGPGGYFGEVVIDGGPRSASVVALENCRCAIIHKAELSRFIADTPEFAEHIMRTLAHRVRVLTDNVRDLAFMDVYGRVARLLLELAVTVDGRQIIPEKLTQKDIAQRVGCSREMAGRVLKVLEEQGLLRATGKTIVVFNARPKVKTRPLIVPVKAGAGSGVAAPKAARTESHDDDDDDEDEDDE